MKIHKPAYVYRHFDRYGILLYVGFSRNPNRRFKQQKYSSWWWEFVASTRIEEFSWWLMAQKAERKSIETEMPIFNIKFNEKAKASEVWRAASLRVK